MSIITKSEQERMNTAVEYVKGLNLDMPDAILVSMHFVKGMECAEKKILDKLFDYLNDTDFSGYISLLYTGMCSARFDKDRMIDEIKELIGIE